MNRFLVYPGIPLGTLRRSLETHFTVCAASEHSQRGGHDAQTEPSSAQKTYVNFSMLRRKASGHRRRSTEGIWGGWTGRHGTARHDQLHRDMALTVPAGNAPQLCPAAERVRMGLISMRTKTGGRADHRGCLIPSCRGQKAGRRFFCNNEVKRTVAPCGDRRGGASLLPAPRRFVLPPKRCWTGESDPSSSLLLPSPPPPPVLLLRLVLQIS